MYSLVDVAAVHSSSGDQDRLICRHCWYKHLQVFSNFPSSTNFHNFTTIYMCIRWYNGNSFYPAEFLEEVRYTVEYIAQKIYFEIFSVRTHFSSLVYTHLNGLFCFYYAVWNLASVHDDRWTCRATGMEFRTKLGIHISCWHLHVHSMLITQYSWKYVHVPSPYSILLVTVWHFNGLKSESCELATYTHVYLLRLKHWTAIIFHSILELRWLLNSLGKGEVARIYKSLFSHSLH